MFCSRAQPGSILRCCKHSLIQAASSKPHPSCALFRNNKRSVDEHRRPMPWRYPIPTACTDGTIQNPNVNLDCRPLPHMQKRPASVDHIALFHYITRSREDFERKVERGGGGGKHRNWGHFNRVQKCAPPADEHSRVPLLWWKHRSSIVAPKHCSADLSCSAMHGELQISST